MSQIRLIRLFVAASLVGLTACTDESTTVEKPDAPTESVRPGEGVWVPPRAVGSVEAGWAVLDRDMNSAEFEPVFGAPPLPDFIGATRVNDHVVAVSLVTAPLDTMGLDQPDSRAPQVGGFATARLRAQETWTLPMPAERLSIRLDDTRVLVLGSRTMPFEQLVELAATVTVDADTVSLPGDVIGTIDNDALKSAIVTMWPQIDPLGSPTTPLPVWTITLRNDEQLDALEAIAAQVVGLNVEQALEVPISAPSAIHHQPSVVQALETTAKLSTLQFYSRMVLVPADPPVAVIGYNAGRYPEINDLLLDDVAQGLTLRPRDELSDAIDEFAQPRPLQSKRSTTLPPLVAAD